MLHRWANPAGFRSVLTLLLSVTLALQVFAAGFPTVQKTPGGGVQVVICGPGGPTTITLDPGTLDPGTPTGAPSPEKAPQGKAAAKCPFCVVGPGVCPATPLLVTAQAEFHLPRAELGTLPAIPKWREHARAIRAPPLTARTGPTRLRAPDRARASGTACAYPFPSKVNHMIPKSPPRILLCLGTCTLLLPALPGVALAQATADSAGDDVELAPIVVAEEAPTAAATPSAAPMTRSSAASPSAMPATASTWPST